MKKAVLFLMITACFCTIAQEQAVKPNNSFDLSYYSTDVGTNICGEYNFNFEKQSLYIGLKCHINRYIKASSYAYHHQFFASHPLEYIGASLGYKYFLKKINSYVSPYLIYNFQYANLWTKNRSIVDGRHFVYIAGPFHAIENSGGLGLMIKLTGRLSLNQSTGVGIAVFTHQQRGFNPYHAWEFMYQWRLGLSLLLD